MATTWPEHTEAVVPVPGGDPTVPCWPETDPRAAASPPILPIAGA